jgi:hypothetical protein
MYSGKDFLMSHSSLAVEEHMTEYNALKNERSIGDEIATTHSY